MVARASLIALLALLAMPLVVGAGEEVTYRSHVAKIVGEHCAMCHRRGGAAPFALTSHRDVVAHAEEIRRVVASGEMPPWKAVGNHGEFMGDRRLSQDQKRLLERWLVAGCLEGDAGPQVAVPAAPSDGWQLGLPDYVIRPVPLGDGEGTILAAELDWPSDGIVAAIEVRPRQAGFEHALLWLDLPVLSQVMEVDDAGEAVSRPALLPAWLRDRLLAPAPSALRPAERAKAIAARDRRLVGVWSYDCLAQSFGESTGFRFPVGSRLIVETPALKSDGLSAPLEIGLHFAEEPPKRMAATAAVEAFVPKSAVAGGLPCQGSFVVPVDCELQLLAPHASAACRELRVGLTLQSGRSESLLWIDRWEPRWETAYQYRRPLQVPAGSRIDVRFTLDTRSHGRAAGGNMPSGPMLVAAQLTPLRLAEYDDLVRAIQRSQMSVARLPGQAPRALR